MILHWFGEMGVSDAYELNEDPNYADTNYPELTVLSQAVIIRE